MGELQKNMLSFKTSILFFIILVNILAIATSTKGKRKDERKTRNAVCGRGKKPTDASFSVGRKDAVIFTLRKGVKQCNALFKLRRSCTRIRLTCQPVGQYYINCSGNDRFIIKTEAGRRRYCANQRPQFGGSPVVANIKPVYSLSLLEVSVFAPSRSSKARCKVRCVATK